MFKQNKDNLDIASVREVIENLRNPSDNSILKSNISQIGISEDNQLEIRLSNISERKIQLSVEALIRTNLAKSKIAFEKLKIRFENAASVTQEAAGPTRKLSNIKNIIAVASGKGGVGKSTVSLNLAATLKARGFNVGVLDADIYGPSLARMIGYSGKVSLEIREEKIQPVEKYGMKAMSFAFLIDEGEPVVWRGPMLGKAIEQFLYDVNWGELDYLVIDLPPGTGDAQLTLAQAIDIDGVLIVTTPQNIALQDASRAIAMFDKVNIPIIGIVENMSEFICPHCGEASHIFASGAGAKLAQQYESNVITQIPLTQEIMQSCENGEPFIHAHIDDVDNKVAHAYSQLAETVNTFVFSSK